MLECRTQHSTLTLSGDYVIATTLPVVITPKPDIIPWHQTSNTLRAQGIIKAMYESLEGNEKLFH